MNEKTNTHLIERNPETGLYSVSADCVLITDGLDAIEAAAMVDSFLREAAK